MSTSGRKKWVKRSPNAHQGGQETSLTDSKPNSHSNNLKKTARERRGKSQGPGRGGKTANEDRSRGKDPETKRKDAERRRRKATENERKKAESARQLEERKRREEADRQEAERARKEKEAKEAERRALEEARKAEEEKRRQEEEERLQAEKRMKEAKEELARLRARLDMESRARDANLKVVGGRREALPMSLNSKMAKTTGFIKKLRLLPDQQQGELEAGFKKLNMSKYIMEMANAIGDIRISKGSDVAKCVKMCSLIHQRYEGFSKRLYSSILNVFGILFEEGDKKVQELPVEEEESENPEGKSKDLAMRRRGALRLITELFKAGVVNDPTPIIYIVTKLKAAEDDSDLTLLISFLKASGRHLVGLTPRSLLQILQDAKEELPAVPELISEKKKAKIREAVIKAHEEVSAKLMDLHKNAARKRRRAARVEMMQGEAPVKIKEQSAALQAEFDALLPMAETLSDLVGAPAYTFPEEKDDDDDNQALLAAFDLVSGQDEGGGEFQAFEDPVTKAFYEDLLDLKMVVPQSFLDKGRNSKSKPNDAKADNVTSKAEETKAKEGEENKADEEEDEDEEIDAEALNKMFKEKQPHEGTKESDETDGKVTAEKVTAEGKEGESNDLNTTQQVRNHSFDMILNSVSQARSREASDEVAAQFCHYNSKVSRRNLVQKLLGVDWRETELLPYHARIIAVLSQVLPEVGEEIISSLFNQLYGLLKSKRLNSLGTMTKNAIYLAELTKFRLYANTKTRIRTKKMLDRMLAIKENKFFDAEKQNLIENAYHSCLPSSKAAIFKPKERPIIQHYIRSLIRADLSRCNSQKAANVLLKRLRKLPWDEECRVWVIKAICNVGRIKFDKLPLLAFLVAGLDKYYGIGVPVVDAILEEIRYGLENPDYTMNQSLLACCRFLGELYSYHMLDLQPILDTLYAIITVGHYQDEDGKLMSKVDPPTDTYRVRLVCMLLQTCGIYFETKHEKKRLERFLVFFQRYLFLKRFIPVSIEFLVTEMLEKISPKLRRLRNLEEAEKKIKQLERRAGRAATRDRLMKLDEISEIPEEKQDIDEDEAANGAGGEGDDANTDDPKPRSRVAANDEKMGKDQVIESTDINRPEEEYKRSRQKEDEKFIKDMDSIMQQDFEARKGEQRTATQMPNPSALIMQLKKGNPRDSNKTKPKGTLGGNNMVFKFLTKQPGSAKASATNLEVPVGTQIVQRTLEHRRREAKEKEDIKRFMIEGMIREREEEDRMAQEAMLQAQSRIEDWANDVESEERNEYNQTYIDENNASGYMYKPVRGGRRGRRGQGSGYSYGRGHRGHTRGRSSRGRRRGRYRRGGSSGRG
ncbi:hypothetical protein AAMO2058_001413700 [Amorphochlora amoebiformis]